MGWVVNATPRPLYHRERPGTHCIGGWVAPKAVKGKANPLQALRVPGVCVPQISRKLAHEGGNVVRTTHRPPLLP
jgi:hypothetical protein